MSPGEMLPATPDALQQLVTVTREVASDVGTEIPSVLRTLVGCCIDGAKLYKLAPRAAQDLRISGEFGFGFEPKERAENLVPVDFTWDILPVTGFDYHQISLSPPRVAGSSKWLQMNLLRQTSHDTDTPIDPCEIGALDYDLLEQSIQGGTQIFTYEVTALQAIMDALRDLSHAERATYVA